jgi:hypothetical protein
MANTEKLEYNVSKQYTIQIRVRKRRLIRGESQEHQESGIENEKMHHM